MQLLDKDYLGDVDRSKGKFRSFLLAALKHFLSKQWARAKTLKRGGGRLCFSWTRSPPKIVTAGNRKTTPLPERLFERRWAVTLLERVLTRLSNEYEATGKRTMFEQLQGCLTVDRDLLPYAKLGGYTGYDRRRRQSRRAPPAATLSGGAPATKSPKQWPTHRRSTTRSVSCFPLLGK